MNIEIMEEIRDKSPDSLGKDIPEELRGKTPQELEKFLTVLDAHLRSIHQTDEGELRSLTDAEETALRYGLAIRDRCIAMIENHRAITEVFNRRPKAVQAAMSQLKFGGDDDPYGDVRRLTVAEARDRALRRLDDRGATAHMEDDQKAHVERTVRKDTDIARRILVTENEHYRDAWLKLVTRQHPMLDEDERKAVMAWEEYRAMSEGVTTAGGFGIPVKLAA